MSLTSRPPAPGAGTRVPRRAARTLIGAAAAAALILSAAAAPGAQAAAGPADSGPTPGHAGPFIIDIPEPLTTSDCLATYGISCYTPQQLRTAYDLNPLYSHGITGAGKTIVVVVPYGSPTIANDLSVFDAKFGLPNPQLQIVPFGYIPPYDPTNYAMLDGAAATTYQVDYAHAIAPGAKIVIAETDAPETEGVAGFPEMMQAEKYLIDHGDADVIDMIFGASENTFAGFDQGNYSSLLNLRYAFQDAAAHGTTVVAAAGDTGPTNTENDGSTLYPYPVATWPASDPLVTAVGGTQLYLNDAGARLQPDTTWNDGFGASGGGVSAIFPRPWYQFGVQSLADNHRAFPDISMSAAVNGGNWVYLSFPGTGGTGWNIFTGTAGATPAFAGIVALADQVAGHGLGLINPALYLLGALSQHGDQATGLVDITQGNNDFGGVTGFTAGPGFDLASGWGTIDAARFVPALAHMASGQH